MVKYNTFEFSKHSFCTNVPLHGEHYMGSIHIKGSIGTQHVYINTVRNFIKKKSAI